MSYCCVPNCHVSCSECRGPSRQECVSCSDPAALLKDGECVSDCGGGFYSQDGVCYGKINTTPHSQEKERPLVVLAGIARG
ncbi:hypothetical protein INR49_003293 [Caranx melampygus]|nr:hypothetical protein INR49_003293 [Caranx melampygus]